MSKNLKIKLPPDVAAEITQVAERTQRSTAFIALRALLAGGKTAPVVATPNMLPFELRVDDDDPASTFAKIKAAAGPLPLDQALAGAWASTRQRFAQWLEQESTARQAEAADELDQGLAEATSTSTPAARLVILASSDYPRIRALVAAHANTPEAVVAKLAKDKEPYVREAVAARGTGKS